MHENAVKIVDQLLENTGILRVCAACEREQGPVESNGAQKSHGTCRRHYIEQLGWMDVVGAEAEAMAAKTDPAQFCPDLAQQHQHALPSHAGQRQSA